MLNGEDGAEKEEIKGVAQHVLGVILRLLHPVMPFITEELWDQFGYGAPGSLIRAAWPEVIAVPEAEAARAELGQVIGSIDLIRSARAEVSVPPGSVLPLRLAVDALDKADGVAGAPKWFTANTAIIERLARVTMDDNTIGFFRREDAVDASVLSLELVLGANTFFLEVGGAIDIAAERARREKELAKFQAEMEKVEAKFRNPDFIARAKPEVIEENRERLEDFNQQMIRARSALARLAV